MGYIRNLINECIMNYLTKLIPILVTVLMTLCMSYSMNAQTTISVQYPYNPLFIDDELVGIDDLLEFIIAFGNDFEPESITIDQLDGIPLEDFLGNMIDLIQYQQSLLDQLTPILSYINVDTLSHSVIIDGANLRITNGSGSTYQTNNGLGNLIIGYDEYENGYTDSDGVLHLLDEKFGSHNFVIGAGHTYLGNSSIVAGRNNAILNQNASVLGGRVNSAYGESSIIIGGLHNKASGELSCILGGHLNFASGERSTVVGGLLNHSGGIATSILGGQYMEIFEQYETASGQYDINN